MRPGSGAIMSAARAYPASREAYLGRLWQGTARVVGRPWACRFFLHAAQAARTDRVDWIATALPVPTGRAGISHTPSAPNLALQ